MLRIVIKEDSEGDNDNHYWLIDFREKEPRVIGPFGEADDSKSYEVSWGKNDVAITTGNVEQYTFNYQDKKIVRIHQPILYKSMLANTGVP